MNNTIEKLKKAKVKNSIALSIFILCAIIVIVCGVLLYNHFNTNNVSNQIPFMKEIYADNPTAKNLVLLCDLLETENNIDLANYIDDALRIDDNTLEETINELYPNLDLSDVDIENYKGKWISTLLAVYANNNDIEAYKNAFIKYLPQFSYGSRMLMLSSSYQKYKNDFVLDNSEIIENSLLHLYEKAENNTDKAEYLNILAAFYHNGKIGKNKESYELLDTRNEILRNCGTSENDIEDIWQTAYAGDIAMWELLIK